MNNKNVIWEKTRVFALRTVKIYSYLQSNYKEYVMSKQLLRCGTSIGANVAESKYAQSLPDFVNKMSIALKEASETEYWITLLYQSEYLNKQEFDSLNTDIREIIKILSSIILTNKNKIRKKEEDKKKLRLQKENS
jgi:four helix bundle protein